MAPPAAAAAKTAKKAGKVSKPINGVIGKTGVMRLSRGRMFHKRGLWNIEKWKKTNEKKPEERKPKKATRIDKKTVKGDKNGGSRQVRVKRFVSPKN